MKLWLYIVLGVLPLVIGVRCSKKLGQAEAKGREQFILFSKHYTNLNKE